MRRLCKLTILLALGGCAQRQADNASPKGSFADSFATAGAGRSAPPAPNATGGSTAVHTFADAGRGGVSGLNTRTDSSGTGGAGAAALGGSGAGGQATAAPSGGTVAAGSGGTAGDTMLPVLASSAPSLRVFGNTSTLELAPVLLAAQTLYKGMASVSNGGIPNLFQGADLATNAETQTLLQSTDHANLRIIFTVCEGWYRIVANRTSAISTLADLRSKKVATIPNTSSAYYLHKMLKSVNLTDSDVTSISMTGPASAQTILQAHQADAVTIWEPEIQHAASALGADVIEFQDRAVYRELFNLHTTAEKLSDQTTRRGIVELVKALVIASDQIRKHPETVWPIVSKSTGFDEQLISQVWVNEGFAGTLAPDLLDVLEEEEAWLARSRGRSARSRTELGTLIDDTVLRDALH